MTIEPISSPEFAIFTDKDFEEFYNEKPEADWDYNLKYNTLTEEQKEEWFRNIDLSDFDAYLGLDHFTNNQLIEYPKEFLKNLKDIIPKIEEMIK